MSNKLRKKYLLMTIYYDDLLFFHFDIAEQPYNMLRQFSIDIQHLTSYILFIKKRIPIKSK